MSSSTSQKFRDFTSEPLKDKYVSEVPGIGPKLSSNLEDSGITKAYELLGIYLTLLKDKEYFELWIRDNAGANRNQARQTSDAIEAFCSQFL
ncbi:unnamed protein product [Didymodactylos carnosus]|uniref:Barrier-to-autointegration factor n=1 Tax=Didymodactylos carnosus TaxID=1234261 RepID=A0A813WZG7_9BILA|nr:unnamed protein product [Didymodactylos carnosus]CAF0862792.1 unnamed protein product [Didymodactylos carnosus]CAF3593728.1 unnamed protein product [Didymodactylos carnosus]CAF3650412.1 unnamed protein product [Didymodactylos carnosus]